MHRRGVHHATSGSSQSSCLCRSSPSPPYDAGNKLTARIRPPITIPIPSCISSSPQRPLPLAFSGGS
jgi:hypothetical protein